MPAVPRVKMAGAGPLEALDPAALHRRARTALIVNLGLGVLAFGLPSLPGAVLAGLALRALPDDVPRAGRLLRWSWGLLAATLVFYLLLLVLLLVLAVLLIAAAKLKK